MDSVSTSEPTLESFIDASSPDEDDESSDDDDDDEFDEFEDEFDDITKKDPSFLKSEQMAVLMARERDVLSSMGHQFQDMVLSCTYRGVSCR